jgi:cellulose synthase (UDP-forming)
MIPQVLVFVFLALTSVVSIWRDMSHSQLSLATAWCVTNTFILGAFIVIAFKESWYNKHPRELVPDPIAGITDVADDEDDDQRALDALDAMIVRPTPKAPAAATSETTTDINDTQEVYAK